MRKQAPVFSVTSSPQKDRFVGNQGPFSLQGPLEKQQNQGALAPCLFMEMKGRSPRLLRLSGAGLARHHRLHLLGTDCEPAGHRAERGRLGPAAADSSIPMRGTEEMGDAFLPEPSMVEPLSVVLFLFLCRKTTWTLSKGTPAFPFLRFPIAYAKKGFLHTHTHTHTHTAADANSILQLREQGNCLIYNSLAEFLDFAYFLARPF